MYERLATVHASTPAGRSPTRSRPSRGRSLDGAGRERARPGSPSAAGDAVRRGRRAPACSASCPALLGGRVERGLVVHPRALRAHRRGGPGRPAGAGFEAFVAEVPDAEEAKTAEVAAFLLGGARPGRLHPHRRGRRRRRRRDHRPGRVRGRDLAARASGSCRCPRRCSAWSTPRSAARPASTPPRARTSSARSTRRPGCCATWRRWRRCRRNDFVAGLAEVVKCGFIADPAILDLSRPTRTRPRGPTVASAARARRARRPVKADGRRRGPQGVLAARDPQLRAHLRRTPSSRSSATPGGTAPRSASAWSTPPSSPGWPAGWTTRWRTGTAASSAASGCRSPTGATAGRSCYARCGGTRRPAGPAAVRRARRSRAPEPAGGTGPGAAVGRVRGGLPRLKTRLAGALPGCADAAEPRAVGPADARGCRGGSQRVRPPLVDRRRVGDRRRMWDIRRASTATSTCSSCERTSWRSRGGSVGWDLQAADPPGALRPWRPGEVLPEAVHDIWCRRTPTSPWCLQIMVDDAENGLWRYRRDARIRRPVVALDGPASGDGQRVLAPEVQLLHKSRNPRPKDEADLLAVRPSLSPTRKRWLKEALSLVAPGHPWLGCL